MNFLHIDDHPMVRDGLALLLREIDKDKQIGVDHAGSCAEAIALADRSYDLIILDMNLPGVHGLDAVSAVREAFPATRLVVLSAEGTADFVHRALDRGAMGYILKSSTSRVLRESIRLVLDGYVCLPEKVKKGEAEVDRFGELTPRQREVFHRLIEGKPNKVIQRELGISESTCKMHVSEIFEKLKVKNRVELVIQFSKQGLRLD
jgi:DNA-binding NarL/FixJ family response regulator